MCSALLAQQQIRRELSSARLRPSSHAAPENTRSPHVPHAMVPPLAAETALMGTALPKPGEIIGGKYRIERALGSGGMGAVFEARHAVTHKHFAIKCLLPEIADRPDSLKRFIREAQVTGRFKHRNVVDVYDICQDEAGVFMVMELLEGESLAERLRRETRLSVSEACRILVPCMEGIAAAHQVGIIHRDIKPANIFLCRAHGREPEQPKVLDFGISRLTSAAPPADGMPTTVSGAVPGTPYYMAPEQMRAQPFDHRVDIYALGVTLYELLSGHRPFDAESYPELVLHIVYGEPKSLRDLAPDVPSALAAVVARAMHRSPDARWATVAEFAQALEPYALGSTSVQTVAAKEDATTRSAAEFDLVKSASKRDRRSMKSLSIWIVSAAVAFGFGILAARRTASNPMPALRDAGSPTDSASVPAAAPNAAVIAAPAPLLVPSAFAADSVRASEHVEAESARTTAVEGPPARAPAAAAARGRTPSAVSRRKLNKALGDGQEQSPHPTAQQAAKVASETDPSSALPASELPPDRVSNVPRRPSLDLDRTGF